MLKSQNGPTFTNQPPKPTLIITIGRVLYLSMRALKQSTLQFISIRSSGNSMQECPPLIYIPLSTNAVSSTCLLTTTLADKPPFHVYR